MSADGSRFAAEDVRLTPLDIDYPSWRRQVIFQCFKWDPQVGDANTISDHACVLAPGTADFLNRMAEALAAETVELEQALARRPDLYAELAIPPPLRRLLQRPVQASPVRVMRFDFHPTADGWAVSEVNSDVPGGFAEAGVLAQLAARHVAGTRPGANPADALAAGMIARIGSPGRIALVHATSYSDDRQVMQYLAGRFTAAGFDCHFAAPDHVRWNNSRAQSIAEGHAGQVDGIVRFYPAEWMPILPASSGWRGYFDSLTTLCNPPQALLGQSKRLPLAWDRLGVATPTWRMMLPETRDPREAPWRTDDGWLLKPAFGRVGEDIAWRGGSAVKEWRRIARSAWLWPRSWVAQRRFDSRGLGTDAGPRNLCIGVFTVDGRACGFYGRLAGGAIVDKHAQDVPVLVATPMAGKAGDQDGR
jgi:glutathionylspermidine synthase